MRKYVYGDGSMGWEPEPEFTHLQRVRNEVTKALHGEPCDLALVAQFLDEIAVHGYRPRPSVQAGDTQNLTARSGIERPSRAEEDRP